MKIIKTFYEERTDSFYKTLKQAKSAHKHPYVYRAWTDESGKILGKYALYAYGDTVGTIANADKELAQKLSNESHNNPS